MRFKNATLVDATLIFCVLFFQTTDCNNTIQPMTLYTVMCYSGLSGSLNIILSFLVGPLGKKRTTLLVFTIAIIAGVVLLFVRQSVASIGLFFVFLYVALVLGNINTYLVELNPTQLRYLLNSLFLQRNNDPVNTGPLITGTLCFITLIYPYSRKRLKF